MLSVENIGYTYNDNVHLSYATWTLLAGDRMILLGSSGSGKTTLLHLLAGLLPPTSGKILFEGEEIHKKSVFGMDKWRGKNVGIVFQQPHLLPSISVEGNVLLAQYFGRFRPNKSEVHSLLDRLGLLALKNRYIHQISHGQACRVAIARSLINQPKLLLADEPTAGLDDKNCIQAIDLLISETQRNNASLIVATHDQRIKKKFDHQLTHPL